MTDAAHNKLRRALARTNLTKAQRMEVLREFTTAPDKRRDYDWQLLVRPLVRTIASLQHGRPRWLPNRAPVYQAYLDTAVEVRDVIYAVLHRPDPPTLASFRKPGADPEFGAHWCTWITRGRREATLRAFEALYQAEPDKARQGARITPFMTRQQRAELVAKWRALLERVTAIVEDPLDPLDPRYTAARQARQVILHHMAYPSPADPPPVQWGHVLNKPAQARLRAARGSTPPMVSRDRG